jgi:hypothetical protein
VVAALAGAIEATEPEKARRLRNMTTELLAAVQPGPAEIAVRSLRRGRLKRLRETIRSSELRSKPRNYGSAFGATDSPASVIACVGEPCADYASR